MRSLAIAALAATSFLLTTTADAQSQRRARGIDRGAAQQSPPRGGFDRYAEPRGGGIITSSTPYPNGNFFNPSGGGGGGNSP